MSGLTPPSALSRRLAGIKGSPMLALVGKTADLRAQGRDLIGLHAGEPDFDTPGHIQEAAIAAMRAGETRYTATEGTVALREAIVRKFARENGLTYTARQVIVSTGAKQVIYGALMATVDPGDEVIIPLPAYPAYAEVTLLCGGTPVHVGCDGGFKLTPESLEQALTERTRWLILCSPSNPTGAVYSAEELRELAQVLARYPKVWVLSDDIYEHLLFDGTSFATMAAAAPEMADRTLTVNGVSKAYCMTGWRIGYGAGPQALVKAMGTLQSQATSGACSVAQAAACAALDGPQDFLRLQQSVYRDRRDLVVAGLRAAPHVHCDLPSGAFYVLASCADALGRQTPNGARLDTDEQFATYLLDSVGVVVVPGSVFGAPGHFRISYAADTQLLDEACHRIATATAQLR